VVRREVPWASGFIDIVARKDSNVFLAFECKRVDEKPWVFVISEQNQRRVTRCRLEWFNGRVEIPTFATKDHSRVFCSEWTLAEPSPESEFCIVPKGTPINSLEDVCSELLAGCHDLLANEEIRLGGHSAIILPVIVTNALLKVCRLDPEAVPLDTGKIDSDIGEFVDADFVRFRKSLVTRRSNSYDTSPMNLREWVGDSERTVFVVRPAALGRFFSRLRTFPDSEEVPKEFSTPPKFAGD
jgi:hypothetical protein